MALQMANSFGSNVINYGRTLARYAEHFGLENISLVSDSNITDSGGDLFINFCRNFLAWSDPPPPTHGRVNVSLDLVEAEILCALNAVALASRGEKTCAAFHAYRHHKSKLDLAGLQAAIGGHVGRLRVNEGAGALQYLHSNLVRQFGARLVEPRASAWLFTPKLAEIPYVRPDYLLTEGNAAIIQDVYRRISVAV
jgi:hypothetical protein